MVCDNQKYGVVPVTGSPGTLKKAPQGKIRILHSIVNRVFFGIVLLNPAVWKLKGRVIGRREYDGEKWLGARLIELPVSAIEQVLIRYSPESGKRRMIVVLIVDNSLKTII